MPAEKFRQIREFCQANSDPDIVRKYSRYFKEGYDGYGIDRNVYEKQRDEWVEEWGKEMSLDRYLELGDLVFRDGKYEEKSFIIHFIQSKRKEYSRKTFDRIGTWFAHGIDNWATTDVICWLVLSDMVSDQVISLKELKEWNSAGSQWQRRAVPVTLVEQAKKELHPESAFNTIEPLMNDSSEYVQKGIGTLLRELWKKHPEETESYLMEWKDDCGRMIVQYATEKMDKEYRKKFRKAKPKA